MAAVTFSRIAYETLEVCNGVEMAAIEAMVALTRLPPGARAVDVGTGNACVAIHLAERFGFHVEAIEMGEVMMMLARERVARAGAERVTLTRGRSSEVLNAREPVDLITAIGSTNVDGTGRPTPEAGFRYLASRLKPGGYLLWGDLTWLGEPSAPLKQLVEVGNQYTDEPGWKAAAEASGLSVEAAEISPQPVFDAYSATMIASVSAWLDAHPDAPEVEDIRFHRDRMKTIFEYAQGVLGFGLYLLKRPA